MVSPEQPSATGQTRTKSGVSGLDQEFSAPIDITSRMLESTSEIPMLKRSLDTSSCTQELVPVPKRRLVTSKDKSNCSKTIAKRSQNSSATLGQAATSNAKVLTSFWDKSKKEVSQRLLSLTKTGLHDSESICLNESSQTMEPHSTWFTTTKKTQKTPENSVTISSQFVTTSWPRTMENEQLHTIEIDSQNRIKQALPKTKKDEKEILLKTRKIKLQLKAPSERQTLMKAFGAARWTYNQAVQCLSDDSVKMQREFSEESWLYFLRHRFVAIDSPVVEENPWLKDVGYDIRDEALKSALTAWKNGCQKVKRKEIEHFKLHFKSRKAPSEAIYLRSKWLKTHDNEAKIDIQLPVKHKLSLGISEHDVNVKISFDCKLQRTRLGDFYICAPVVFGAKKVENQDPKALKICSMDPGVRTFQTIFDASNSSIIEVGKGDIGRIIRLYHHADALQSKMKKVKSHQQKLRMRRARLRIYERAKHYVDELHKQLAKHLATNYDLIMLPSFETSKMVKKDDRVFGKKTAREMASWAHYRFKQRLIFKCHELGSKVAIVNEAWTSKTCSSCGFIHHSLGSSKTFNCPQCKLRMDRDANGAKNIFLRNYQALEISVSSFGAYPYDRPKADCAQTLDCLDLPYSLDVFK